MKQKKPTVKSNAPNEEEDPLDGDLSEFILEGIRNNSWQVVQFEFTEKKDTTIALRLSKKLLAAVKTQAGEMGVDTQKFIRLALENAIRKK